MYYQRHILLNLYTLLSQLYYFISWFEFGGTPACCLPINTSAPHPTNVTNMSDWKL